MSRFKKLCSRKNYVKAEGIFYFHEKLIQVYYYFSSKEKFRTANKCLTHCQHVSINEFP